MASVAQVTLAELQEAHRRGAHAQIQTWRKGGQLDGLLAGGQAADDVDDEPEPEAAPVGSADQGARPGGPQGQIDDTNLKRLYAERRYDEISRARREGRLDRLLGRRW